MKEDLLQYQIIKETPKLLPLIYRDCAQPSVKKVGQALATVFDLSNTILLPLKLVNEIAKLNFQKRIDKYKANLERVEEDKIIDVSTIIGMPIIDRLTYITNDEIADLFINLLTKASSIDTVNEAHPAFIHIIDRMTVDEARLISHFSTKQFIPYINMISRSKVRPHVFRKLAWNLTGIEKELELLSPQNIDTYLDNLSSLKIIESQGSIYNADEDIYLKLIESYYDLEINYNKFFEEEPSEYNKIEIEKRVFVITELGSAFIKAVHK